MVITIAKTYFDRLVTLNEYGEPDYVFDSATDALDCLGRLNGVTLQRVYRREDGSDDDREEFFELVPYYVDDTHLVTSDLCWEEDRWAIQGSHKEGTWNLDTESQDLSFCHALVHEGTSYGYFVKTAELVS